MYDPVEPIAVIGFDAKLPCDGDTPEAFYKFIVHGRSARAPIPKERYNASSFWHPDTHRDGVISGDQAHLLQANVKAFDAPFFSITPAEAASMDPQQRMLLECVYTALENSGKTLDAVQGSQTGVYLGAFIFDYHDILMKDVEAPMMYTGSGNLACTMAGRVSWFYDLKGPAISIDTACSSSMVALHQAVLGLKAGDCDMAIACGANLILSPEMGLKLNALGVLNSESTCFSFDERANGYGRGEGVGAVVLKRMSDAIRDGDTIRAVIRNTGCNQDGHSPGLTAPLLESQAELMRKTYSQARIDPAETRFFDAHSTGTAIGDPIESGAIASVFNSFRSADRPLIIGALKSNIGHSEGASGIASIIKAIITLERGIIPANTWFEKKNPKIPDHWHFFFPLAAMTWPNDEGCDVRRMSINSFGVSGTNAHVIMEDAYSFLKDRGLVAPHWTVIDPKTKDTLAPLHPFIRGKAQEHTDRSAQIYILSSQDKEGVARLCKAYDGYLQANPSHITLHDLSYTLAMKRTQFRWRAAIIASSREELLQALASKQTVHLAKPNHFLGLVFTGQGAQWARMGIELLRYPVFRKSVQDASVYFNKLGSAWSAEDELMKTHEKSHVNEAELSQPLCTMVQVALLDLIISWGIWPQAVVGHSSGEICASYATGAISRESAWRISYWRGKLAADLIRTSEGPPTTMAAVGLDATACNRAIEEVQRQAPFFESPRLTIACINSKTSHTVSGEVQQIDSLVSMVKSEGKFARKLAVEIGYHSRYMEPIVEEYARRIGSIDAGNPCRRAPLPLFFSSTYGKLIDLTDLQDPSYWVKNLVSPVRFREAVSLMLVYKDPRSAVGPPSLLLEVGPHGALQGPLRNIAEEVQLNNGLHYQSLLRRGESDILTCMNALGQLYATGVPVDIAKMNRIEGLEPTMLIDLPRYCFNHSREYWYESRLSRNFRNRRYPRHELLGAPVSDWNGKYNAIWRNWIRVSENPWVEHHTVSGEVLYPAAGMLVMVIEACGQLAERAGIQIKGFRFREVSFHSALQVPGDNMGIESHLYLRPFQQTAMESQAPSWLEFQICTAQEDDEWREHCRGQVLIEHENNTTAVDGGLEARLLQQKCEDIIKDAQQTCVTQVAAKDMYTAWEKVGLAFGPTFQTVVDPLVNHKLRRAVARVKSTLPLLRTLMPKEYVQPHLIHPTTLDGALQVCLAHLVSDPERQQKKPVVLTFIDELWVSGTQVCPDVGGDYIVCAETESCGRDQYKMKCTAVDHDGFRAKILVEGLIVKEVDGVVDSGATDEGANHQAWTMCWKPDPVALSDIDVEHAVGSSERSLVSYLDILAHKNPGMRVIQLGASVTAALVTLESFGSRFAHCDLTNSSHDTINNIALKIRGHQRTAVKPLSLSQDPSQQGFELGAYDLAITTDLNFIPSGDDVGTAINYIRQLLKPTGRLVLGSISEVDEISSWNACLFQHGFSGPDAQFRTGSSSSLVTSVAKTSPPSIPEVLPPCTYFIVRDSDSKTQNQIATRLASSLYSRGTVQMCSVSDYAVILPKISKLGDTICILLSELTRPILSNLDTEELVSLQAMMDSHRLIWMHKDGEADFDLVTGFAACVRLEHPDLELIVASFESGCSTEIIVSKVLEIDSLVTDRMTKGETSYKISKNGIIAIPRLVKAVALTQHIQSQTSSRTEICSGSFGDDPRRSLKLICRDIGLLDSICFDEDDLFEKPMSANEVEFRTMATGVNFKDLAVLLGKISETSVGLEAAGVVTRVGSEVTRFKKGDRVFGFAFQGAFSTHVRALEGTIALIPLNLTFVDAAAIPVVYTTAYACLYDIGNLDARCKRSKRPPIVLIHAASGGVGQAAIQLCLREGAEVFATVGSLEKRDFLQRTYDIPCDHIFSSRDTTFKSGIMRMTDGRGADIILNSLSGEMLRASWDCIAAFGAFVEIGLSDIESRSRISMQSFAKNARFQSLELNFMQNNDMERMEDLFQRAMESIFLDKELIRTTPIRSYPISQLQTALRFMQSGKHIGKLVVETHEHDIVPMVKSPRAHARLSPDATYVVSGGFGGLGQHIIQWLVQNGAKHLLVTSRRGPTDSSAKGLVEGLQKQGVQIAAPPCDITDVESLRSTLHNSLRTMPSVRGCFQASTILKDNAFKEMTLDQWHDVLDVKVVGTRNLWETLSPLAEKMDFFIMLSSMASIIGNPGQTNYAAGNSFQDAFAREQSALGHRVIALNVPMMNDAGMVATKPHLLEYLYSIGWSHMSSKELLSTLDYYCHPFEDHGSRTFSQGDAQVVPRLWLPRYSATEGASQPEWQKEPKFNHMVLHEWNKDAVCKQESNKQVSALLSTVTKFEEAESILLGVVTNKLSQILNIPVAELDASRPMSSYGVDSLVAVELRTWMTKEIGCDISVFQLTSANRISQVVTQLTKRSRFVPSGLTET